MKFLKGQGATEYLVLLAVVLIVALVSVALLGAFPSMATDARITQSQSYWRGQARPFAIIDAALNTSHVRLSVQNMEATGPYVINAITIGGVTATISPPVSFTAGEIKYINYTWTKTDCTSGALYDYNVTIDYDAPDIGSKKQHGTRNLIGRCV